MVDGMLIFVFCDFEWMLLKIKVLVHPQLGLLCGAAQPGVFFCLKNAFFEKKHDLRFAKFFKMYCQMDLICY